MHSHSARPACLKIRPVSILAAAIVALAVIAQGSWAQAPEGDIPFDPEAHHGVLSNGLTWYVKENREPLNRAQLRLAIRAGSILEEEHEQGLAHYLEHMAFNGTERFSGHEIIEYLESIGSKFGPDLNAHTSFDETVYKIEIPTDDPEIIDTAFEILSDWAFAIVMDPEEVEQERGVVLEEWRTRRGAGARIRDLQYPVLFGESRYSERLPIGLPEVIETATLEDLQGFYERWYRPDLMAVAIVGDFEAERMVELIRRHFASPPEGEAYQERAARPAAPTVRPEYPVPPHAEPRVTVETDPEMSSTTIRIYSKLPPRTGQSVATYRHLLTQSLFAMMANARLFERTQVADPPFIGAWFGQGLFLANTAVLYASARVDEDGVERGLDTVLEEMQRILRYGFTATELEREKANLLRSMESAWLERDQRPSVGLVEEYVRHYMEGETVPGIDAEYELHQQLLPEITLQEVNTLAEPWRTMESTVAMISGPEAVASGPEVEQALLAKLQGTASLQVDPYEDIASDVPLMADLPAPGSITAEEPIEEIDAVRWTLSNGATVIAKQTDFRNDQVLLKATSPGGTSLVADGDYIAAITATAIAEGSGAGVHDRVALDKLLAGNTAAAEPFIGALFEGFSGSSSPEDLETLFQLVTLYGTAPRLDPTYFSSYSSRLRSHLENRRAQPDAVWADTLRSALSQDHFRSRPFTVEVLEEMDLERSIAVYEDRFADFGDFTFIIVGSFDWDQLRTLASTYLAALPAAGRQEQWRDLNIDPPPEVVDLAVYKGIEPRSRTRLVFAGEMDWSRPEAMALVALKEMLQAKVRERIELDLGSTYSIHVGASASLLPDPEYRVFVDFGSDPARADELLDEVFGSVDWLVGGGEQEYLDTAKELISGAREEQQRRNGFWLGQIEAVVERGEDFSVIPAFDDRLEALTLNEVVDAAARYLSRDRYVRVVLLPEESATAE
ncbi:MAG: insulinase family protein [Spirochaetaceae bacterium]|nr:insulinase family protein [Spirochaetaceae bacterium]